MSTTPLDVLFSAGDAQRLPITARDLDRIVEEHAIEVLHRPAVPCPCAKPGTRQAIAGCPLCQGLGLLFPAELEENLIAVIQSRSPRRERKPAGDWVTGDCTVTFMSGVVPAAGDLIQPAREQHVVVQLVRRATPLVSRNELLDEWARDGDNAGAGDEQLPQLNPTGDRLLYPAVTALEFIAWRRGSSLVRASAAEYALVGNEIRWTDPSQAPAPGAFYTVRYSAPATYQIMGQEPIHRQTRDGQLNYRASAKPLYRVSSEDIQDNGV